MKNLSMENTLRKLEEMFLDMETHKRKDNSEIYGGITYLEFKAMLCHLILTCDIDTTKYGYIVESCRIQHGMSFPYSIDIDNNPTD